MSGASDRRRPRHSPTTTARAPARAPRPPFLALHAPPGVPPGQERLLIRATWIVVALVGAALLAMVLGPHRIGDYMTETDFYGQYAEGARLIQQGRLDPARFGVVGPGYEIALALAGFVVRALFLAAGLLSAAAAVIAFEVMRQRQVKQ